MDIPILLEPLEGGRYRARAGEPFACCAEGNSRSEAYQNVARIIQERLKKGAELIPMVVGPPPSEPPSTLPIPADSLYLYDPSFKELQEAIAENRRREDEE